MCCVLYIFHVDTSIKIKSLKGRRIIQNLFLYGKSFFLYPIKVVYLPKASQGATDSKISLSLGIGASKKKLRRAVERNLVKRRLREAFLSITRHWSDKDVHILSMYDIFIIHIGHDVPDYAAFSSKLSIVMQRLVDKTKKSLISNE